MPGSVQAHPSTLTKNTAPSADPNCTLQVTGSMCVSVQSQSPGWINLISDCQHFKIKVFSLSPKWEVSSQPFPGNPVWSTQSSSTHFVLSSHKNFQLLQGCPAPTEHGD
jgi:hypothetical protein